MISDIKAQQEALREKKWTPKLKWKAILDTLNWAESQNNVNRNTPSDCLRRQAQKNRST